jgi:hypothetical protein
MILPMEYPRPKKTKYVDEETTVFNRWMIFGEHPDGIHVDIHDGTEDIITRIPREKAERLIAARNVFINTLLDETE